ncbi:MAG: hypothetical protein K8U03_06070 [Planctomycetia bacterium]|nr:hypothetical protein [Planctomycetia bacterium]
MSQPSPTPPLKKPNDEVESVILVSYPKIIFLYPSLIFGFITALYLSFSDHALNKDHQIVVLLNTVFLAVLAVNLVVLAFDFPRTTSLTMFFCIAAVILGLVLLFTLKPELLPAITQLLARFRPLANATFYWSFTAIVGSIFAMAFLTFSFDYWEVRPNEILHHHGFLSNLERRAAPNLRIDKEINDLFEYMLLHSGRLILQPANERAIILDNVPFIKHKEKQIMQLLGALKVDIRQDDET